MKSKQEEWYYNYPNTDNEDYPSLNNSPHHNDNYNYSEESTQPI